MNIETPKELVDELVMNVIKYGTGFTKLSRNAQGELETSIVPFEDYMYINGKPEWVGLTDEERLFVLLTAPPTFMNHAGDVRETAYSFAEIVQKLTEAKLKEKNT